MKDKLKNPFRPVKNVRTVFDRFQQKNVKEVQVQFSDEDPAWIPYDTLIAMMETEIEQWM
ncbi:uncharacterized protein METZ01_LOCUS296441 [marine metagenome]|uniref:Uncharacterized protein n=1 Tax=marine metagenome TaxID=408172 RepID=A0A382M7B7_9ZZZZ